MVYRRRSRRGGRRRKYKRYSKKRYSGRRKYSRRRYNRRRGAGFGGVLSQKRTAKMIYVNSCTIDPNSWLNGGFWDAQTQISYRMNCPYDPQLATAGGTPLNQTAAGWSFWARFYNHYEVVKATIVYKVTQAGGGGGISSLGCPPLVCGLKIDDDSNVISNYTSWEQCLGDPSNKFGTLRFTWDQGNSRPVKLKYTWRKSKFLNGDGSGNQALMVSGTSTSNIPAEGQFAIPWFQLQDKTAAPGGVTAPSIHIYTHITYTVKMWEPKDIPVTGIYQGA